MPTSVAMVKQQDVEKTADELVEVEHLSAKLDVSSLYKLDELNSEYEFLFAQHHKRSNRCKLHESHSILTGDAPPQRTPQTYILYLFEGARNFWKIGRNARGRPSHI